jgi:hypothetical protein
VLPAAGAATLGLVLPYGIAMKLTIVSGVVALPAATWGFARWWRLPFPTAPLVAVASVSFLFDRATDGGVTITSTISGEHSHSIAFTLGVVTLGMFAFVVYDGRWRVVSALLLAATLLAHPLGAIFVASGIVAVVVVHLGRDWRTLLARVVPVVAIGAAIAGIWWIPFAAYRGWMTSPDFPSDSLALLAPFGWAEPILVALGAAGVVLGWRAGRRIAGALAVVAVVHVVLFVIVPGGQLQDDRLAPVVAWCVLALAAIGIAECALAGAARVRPARAERVLWVTPVLALAVVLVAVSAVWRTPPFGRDGETFDDGSIEVAFEGYQGNPQFPPYEALMTTVERLGRERGCGRLAWTTDIRTTDFGTLSNDLAPYWTDGCIQTTTALYYDSSATTPMIALTESLTGILPPAFAPDLPYRRFDLDEGVRHLRYLGVRYYAARTEPVIAVADAHPDLRRVARAGPWRVYEITDHALVTTLAQEPIVFAIDGVSWADGSVAYTEQVDGWDQRVLTESGPAAWSRVQSQVLPGSRAIEPAQVSRIRVEDDALSFRVDRVGRPVLVKASAFPRWRASGADGPYRAAGNLMVVVPTERTVRLEIVPTPVDWLARLSLGAGIVGAIVLGVHDRRRRVR